MLLSRLRNFNCRIIRRLSVLHSNNDNNPLKGHTNKNIIVRKFGGYIEDAQLAQLGLEIYQEIYGQESLPSATFVIPNDDSRWPNH